MEIIVLIIVVIIIGFFIIPSKGRDNLTAHAVREDGCTCKNLTRFSMDLDYDCPVHGDWADH